MKVLSVANSKGGVGKTSVSVNLAWELACKGYLVILIDLDPQGDLSKVYYRGTQPAGNNLNTLLHGQCSSEEACYPVRDNLYLIPSNSDLKHFHWKASENLLAEILHSEDFKDVDVVILDNPPATSELTLMGYTAATDVLVVTDPEAFGIANIGDFLSDLEGIKTTLNPNLNVLGILVNRVDQRRKLTEQVLITLRSSFGSSMFTTTLSNDTVIPKALMQRKAVREMGWSSKITPQINNLAQEIEARWGGK